MSDKNSTRAALMSNISERDRAKDVKQVDDFLRTSINETSKFENRFGKMPADKKLMPERLLNFRLRGRTMSHSELLVALENIIIKVASVPTARNRKIDTRAPMEIGMAAKDDGEKLREGSQRTVDLALHAAYKGTGKGQCFWTGSELE